jgi:hypothetical protein
MKKKNVKLTINKCIFKSNFDDYKDENFDFIFDD